MPEQSLVEIPINIRLKEKSSNYAYIKLKPRGYQTELSIKALHENAIIYLGTGLGKTFIVTLYLNFPQIDEQISNNKKVVFLAPTQDLIKQQAEFINKQVRYKIKVFCGRSAHCGEHIDCWSKEVWSTELNNIDMLFCTPQIFASAISTNLLEWDQFASIIFDEVHHACKNVKKKDSSHPYSQIIKHYKSYYSLRPNQQTHPRPRLIGLTASLINSMPKNRHDITFQLKSLETMFQARCITDINVIESKPEMVIRSFCFNEVNHLNDFLCEMIQNCCIKFEEVLKTKEFNKLLNLNLSKLSKEDQRILAYQNRLKLAAAGFSIKPNSFSKVMTGLQHIRARCGIWQLRAICTRLTQALNKHGSNTSLRLELKSIYQQFTSIVNIMVVHLTKFLSEYGDDGLIRFTRPKCLSLLVILEEEFERVKDHQDTKSSFSCIVFVRSRLEVLAITLWLQEVSLKMSKYNFIKCDYAIGIAATMTSKYSCITKRKSTDQQKMLDNFRKGLLNVIITTSVLEEGIDLPTCSTVIRYDQPNTFREYIQSRGRARQRISSFYSITSEIDMHKIIDKLDKFNDFEYQIQKILGTENMDIRNSITYTTPKSQVPEEEEDFLLLNDNKARISASTAKTILNMYCQRLAKHTPFTDGVRVDRIKVNEFIQTIIYLPSGCPLNNQGIWGNPKTSSTTADNSAVVAAVKALYNAKELDDRGCPARVSPHNIDKLLEECKLKPDFKKIEEQLDVTDLKLIDNKESFIYEPMMAQLGDYMYKDFESRTYKLLRLRHIPVESSRTRLQTREFFACPIYGIIVDSYIPNEFIKTHIFGHYGEFQVEVKEISNNLLINNREHHQEYLNYTHKLLTKCLTFHNIQREDFRYHCRCYIVLLDDQDRPNISRMRRSFINTSYKIKVGDVVKLQYFYQNTGIPREDRSLLFIVKCIHTANYKIPDTKAESSYRRLMADMRLGNSNIVEVVAISKSLADIRPLKSKGRNFVSSVRFYPEQCLQYFDDNPSAVFQAYNLPIQIFSLYKANNVLDLDKKILHETKQFRQPILKQANIPTELDVALPDADLHNERAQIEPDTDVLMTGGDETQPDIEMETIGDGEESDVETDDESIVSYDSESSNNSELVGPEYKDLIGKKNLDLNDDDDDKFERWKMSDYEEKDLKKLEYKISNSANLPYSDETSAYQSEIFLNLKNNVSDLTNTLVGLLMTFETHLVGNSYCLDEDTEFSKRQAKVNLDIAPSVKFDKIKPFKSNSRCTALLEALTLSRALESYNLECLENCGDSYLKYVTSVVLYKAVECNEGFLTSARSRLVSNKHFTLLARMHNLGAYALTHGFSKDYLSYILGQNMDEKPVSKYKPKHLADLIESIIGSHLVYLGEFEALLAIRWLGLDIFNESTFDRFQENSVVFAKPPSPLINTSESRDYYRSCKKKFSKFEEIISYKFNDPAFLVQALTHASSTLKCTRSYERLEFLGDAILDYLVTMNLVMLGDMKSPGQMSSSRSAIVNNVSLAKLAIKYKYDLFIQHSSQDMYDELARLRFDMEEDPDMAFLDMLNFDKIVKLLGDVFESVAAAIYLDSGCSLDIVWSIYYPMLSEEIESEIKNPTKNAIVMLNEMYPGKDRISYEVFDVKTSDVNLVGVSCVVKGYGSFEGRGLSMKQAKLRAIKEALKNAPSAERRAKMNEDFMSQNSFRRQRNNHTRQGSKVYQKKAYRGPQRSHQGHCQQIISDKL